MCVHAHLRRVLVQRCQGAAAGRLQQLAPRVVLQLGIRLQMAETTTVGMAADDSLMLSCRKGTWTVTGVQCL